MRHKLCAQFTLVRCKVAINSLANWNASNLWRDSMNLSGMLVLLRIVSKLNTGLQGERGWRRLWSPTARQSLYPAMWVPAGRAERISSESPRGFIAPHYLRLCVFVTTWHLRQQKKAARKLITRYFSCSVYHHRSCANKAWCQHCYIRKLTIVCSSPVSSLVC